MQKKRWEQIRVQDILLLSGVGRSTFYAHFDNKFDLLTSRIPDQALSISGSGSGVDVYPLFVHVEEMSPILKPLLSQPVFAEIADQFHRSLRDAWDAQLETLGVPPKGRGMASEILAGSLLAIVRKWVLDRCHPSATDMATDFHSFVAVITAEAHAQGEQLS